MTKPELDAWIASAKFTDGTVDYDSSSNRWEQKIYEKDGKFYSIEYCNGGPFRKRGARDDYEEPQEVIAKTQTIVKTDWFPVEENV